MSTKAELLKELEAIKAKIEALEEPEVEMVKGRLYEVARKEKFMPYPPVERYWGENCGNHHAMYVDGTMSSKWEHWRELKTSATKREWTGGEMPVDGETLVAYELQSGYYGVMKACDLIWGNAGDNIIAYWELQS